MAFSEVGIPEEHPTHPTAQAAPSGRRIAHDVALTRYSGGKGKGAAREGVLTSVGPRGDVSPEALARFDSIEVGDGKELVYIDGAASTL